MYDTKTSKKTVLFNATSSQELPKGTPVRVYEAQHGLARVRATLSNGATPRGIVPLDALEPKA